MPAFGWRPGWDPQNEDYRARKLVPPGTPLRGKGWQPAPVLDQSNEGTCGGHAGGGEAGASPKRVPMDATTGHELALVLFDWAADHDPFPGDSRMLGTTTLAIAQSMQNYGYWENYYWSKTDHEAALVIGYEGPVLWGTPWMTGMMDTDAAGYIHHTGIEEGGHLVYLWSYSYVRDDYTGSNSWSPEWGHKFSKTHTGGDFRVPGETLRWSLANGAEICCGVGRSIP